MHSAVWITVGFIFLDNHQILIYSFFFFSYWYNHVLTGTFYLLPECLFFHSQKYENTTFQKQLPGAGAVVQQVRLLPVTPACHMATGSYPICSTSVLANGLERQWKIAQARGHNYTHESPGWSAWLQPGPAPAFIASWGVKKLTENVSLSLPLCDFQINKSWKKISSTEC